LTVELLGSSGGLDISVIEGKGGLNVILDLHFNCEIVKCLCQGNFGFKVLGLLVFILSLI
jgi:hypothetical protein